MSRFLVFLVLFFRCAFVFPVHAAPPAVSVLPSVSALSGYNFANTPYIQLLGYTTPGDGGGGLFYYNASDTTSSTDNCTIFLDSASHRFYRIWDGINLLASYCGIFPNTALTTDVTTKLVNAIKVANNTATLVFPVGCYLLSAQIDASLPSNIYTVNIRGAKPEYFNFAYTPAQVQSLANLNAASFGAAPWLAVPSTASGKNLCAESTVLYTTSNFLGAPDSGSVVKGSLLNINISNLWLWGAGSGALMGIYSGGNTPTTGPPNAILTDMQIHQFGMYGGLFRGVSPIITRVNMEYSGYQSGSGGNYQPSGSLTYPYTYQTGGNLLISGTCGPQYYSNFGAGHTDCRQQGTKLDTIYLAQGYTQSLPSPSGLQVVGSQDITGINVQVTAGALFGVLGGVNVTGGHFENYMTGGLAANDNSSFAIQFYDSVGVASPAFVQNHSGTNGYGYLALGSGNSNVYNGMLMNYAGAVTAGGPIVSTAGNMQSAVESAGTISFPGLFTQIVPIGGGPENNNPYWPAGKLYLTITSSTNPALQAVCEVPFNAANGDTAGVGTMSFGTIVCTQSANITSGYTITVASLAYNGTTLGVTATMTYGASYSGSQVFYARAGIFGTSSIAGAPWVP